MLFIVYLLKNLFLKIGSLCLLEDYKDIDSYLKNLNLPDNPKLFLQLSLLLKENIFSRYEDNTTKTGIIFQNDSYEWETKLRYQTTHFVDQWKWATGFNLQKSSYKNNTVFNYYDISYNTTLNFCII